MAKLTNRRMKRGTPLPYETERAPQACPECGSHYLCAECDASIDAVVQAVRARTPAEQGALLLVRGRDDQCCALKTAGL